MDCEKVAEYITDWLERMCRDANTSGFVIGISGGIDSALCSVLAARTGLPTLCVTLPIHQPESHVSRADDHIDWLKANYSNVDSVNADLTTSFDTFCAAMPRVAMLEETQHLTEANSRARLRMTALYYFSGSLGRLVVGTGNKIEDFGVGFFTKYGDGGVDISPIADLTKTQVYELAEWLEVNPIICEAPPADGLFGDDRSDEDQIGATYAELEWAMEQLDRGHSVDEFAGREREVMDIYIRRHRANLHKMVPIPICEIPAEYK